MDAERIVELIEMLVADEGAELKIICPNPDFDGPDRIIDICDQWTDWDTARFEGGTLQEALEAAIKSREAGEGREKLKRMYGLSFGLVEPRTELERLRTFIDKCEAFLDCEGMASTDKEVAEVISRYVGEARQCDGSLCPTCRGSGVEKAYAGDIAGMDTCGTCKGTGTKQ